MTLKITAQDARNKFAEILNTAVFGKKDVIITRFDKPQAVLIDYEEYQRLINPRSRFSDEEWEKGFKIFDTIRARTKNTSPKQIEKVVGKAIGDIRKEKRV